MQKGRAEDSRPAFDRALIPPASRPGDQQPQRLFDFEPFDFDLVDLHFELLRLLLRLRLPHDGGVGLQLERPVPPAP
jgi:hypothetical protein